MHALFFVESFGFAVCFQQLVGTSDRLQLTRHSRFYRNLLFSVRL